MHELCFMCWLLGAAAVRESADAAPPRTPAPLTRPDARRVARLKHDAGAGGGAHQAPLPACHLGDGAGPAQLVDQGVQRVAGQLQLQKAGQYRQRMCDCDGG